MPGVAGSLPLVYTLAVVPSTPLQALGPSAVFDSPGPVRALAAFVLVSAVGGLLLWRYEPFVDRSIDASMARPLSSLGYGLAAHAVIAFAAGYLSTQLAGFDAFGMNGGAVGLVAGLLLALVAASVGFTVAGTALVEFRWGRRLWYGLLVGALVAGAAGLLDNLAGGLLWFVVVSMGIGGPVRRWLHADEPWK